MQAVFHCPRCLKTNAVDVARETTAIACRHCGWTKVLAEGEVVAGTPQACLVCGCADLWRQKDFPQRLGVTIVAVGVVLSTIAVAMMRPFLGLGVLMTFALADMVLFAVMRDALVCYRCHARYRRVDAPGSHSPFDLETNERYRQESARMDAARRSQAVG